VTSVKIPYGDSYLAVDLAGANVIYPNAMPEVGDELSLIRDSLEKPIGAPKLGELVDERFRVSLIVSDITRPCPSHKIVPIVLDVLKGAGVRRENVKIVFATGIHRSHTYDEWVKLLGPNVVRDYMVVDHNCRERGQLRYVGKTSRGTPVIINSNVVDADFRIGIANIDAHYFAGYSGGGKSVLPGVAAYESIRENHRLMLSPGAELGRIDGNPVREDIEEAASISGLEYIVNVVLNEEKRVVKSVSGHYIKAHREGVKAFNNIYGVNVGRRYDIVVASPGGYPKDINLYQAHKALEVASKCVKAGGVIILVAECREGVGEGRTEELLYSQLTPEDIVEFIKGNFDLGYHKAYAIARIALRAHVIVVSSSSIRSSKAFTRVSKLDDAIKKAYDTVGRGDVLILPYASSIIPKDLV